VETTKIEATRKQEPTRPNTLGTLGEVIAYQDLFGLRLSEPI